MKTSVLASLVRNKLPDAVVRDDHCDVVRVSWQGRIAFVEPHEEIGIQIRLSLRPIPDASDSVPPPQLLDFAPDPSEAAEKVVFWLKRVDAISIDRY